MKRLTLIVAVGATFLLLLQPTPAHADTRATCREIGRALHSDLLGLDRESKADYIRYRAQLMFEEQATQHPDCLPELAQLAAYYSSGGKTAFPYPKRDEPSQGFLGPIGWWWNIVYVKAMNRNTAMMVTFGWEMFLFPLFMAISIPVQLLRLILGAAWSSIRGRPVQLPSSDGIDPSLLRGGRRD